MYAGRRTQKKPGGSLLPARLVEASTRKPCVKARITVCLGTDSVNPFRQQIYKSLVSVALKPQTEKPPGLATDGSAFAHTRLFECRWEGIIGYSNRVTSSEKLHPRGQSRTSEDGPGPTRNHTTSPAYFLCSTAGLRLCRMYAGARSSMHNFAISVFGFIIFPRIQKGTV